MKEITFIDVRDNATIQAMIEGANKYLEAIGYTDHGPKHVGYVSRIASDILRQLDYPKRTIELCAIAGWIHDVGNMINRKNHGLTGATILFPILTDMGMNVAEAVSVCTAVGNHEEDYGCPVNELCAALIIADKIDAHRTRVRRNRYDSTDIHDRVNYSIQKTHVTVDRGKQIIRFSCIMDGTSSIKEFLEIYMSRMNLATASAHYLGCRFELWINDTHVNKVPEAQENRHVR